LSVRTVYRDLRALEEAGVPLAAEAGVGYRLQKQYHLPPVMLTSEEASALFTGAELVGHLTDPSLKTQMQSALLKIRSVLPSERQEYLDRLQSKTLIAAGLQRQNPGMPDGVILQIQRALVHHRVLALTYQAGQSKEVSYRKVEPLGLVYYDAHWHLIAFCRLRRDYRDFRTDRIGEMTTSEETFSEHSEFSLRTFIEASWQAEMLHRVTARFPLPLVERARKQCSSGLVEERWDNGSLLLTFFTWSLDWISGWLLSLGPAAEVISPPELRDLVRQKAQLVAELYR
jgi:predicted DNA-binding transcriptional regulator YafY